MFDHDTDSRGARPESWPERLLLWLAMLGILGLCAVVTITVVSRWFHNALIPDDVLIVRELMVAVIILPLAAVTAARAHISVTVFTDRVGPAWKSRLEILGHVIGLCFALVILFAGWRLFVSAWQSGEYFDGILYLPMWIGYGIFVTGLLAFALRLLVNIVGQFVNRTPESDLKP